MVKKKLSFSLSRPINNHVNQGKITNNHEKTKLKYPLVFKITHH
jgi:hypothetical protein